MAVRRRNRTSWEPKLSARAKVAVEWLQSSRSERVNSVATIKNFGMASEYGKSGQINAAIVP